MKKLLFVSTLFVAIAGILGFAKCNAMIELSRDQECAICKRETQVFDTVFFPCRANTFAHYACYSSIRPALENAYRTMSATLATRHNANLWQEAHSELVQHVQKKINETTILALSQATCGLTILGMFFDDYAAAAAQHVLNVHDAEVLQDRELHPHYVGFPEVPFGNPYQ